MPTHDRLRELLTYDPVKGEIRTKKGRLLVPDHDGLVTIFDANAKPKHKKYKLNKIAYYLAFGLFPRKDQVVLHKNLDSEDYKIHNLLVVSKKVFCNIKEAQKNLSGGIKITPHPEDQFAYEVNWFEEGKPKKVVHYDIAFAQRVQTRLILKFSKFLTKYCLFDN